MAPTNSLALQPRSRIRNFPGLRYAFGPESFTIKWRIPYLAAGNFSLWLKKHGDFERFGADIISSVRAVCLASS